MLKLADLVWPTSVSYAFSYALYKMQFIPSDLLGLSELVGLTYVQNLGLLMKRASELDVIFLNDRPSRGYQEVYSVNIDMKHSSRFHRGIHTDAFIVCQKCSSFSLTIAHFISWF